MALKFLTPDRPSRLNCEEGVWSIENKVFFGLKVVLNKKGRRPGLSHSKEFQTKFSIYFIRLWFIKLEGVFGFIRTLTHPSDSPVTLLRLEPIENLALCNAGGE